MFLNIDVRCAMRVVILAGGEGRRLHPYTTVLPKPMMPVGDMPILEILLRQLRRFGIDRVTISVGHLGELIMAFFQDGSRWGIKIDYVVEDKPLGTMGPLRLIKDFEAPFLVMNGDLLTTLNFLDLYTYHESHDRVATVATYEKEIQLSLGVLETETEDDRTVTSFSEKPVYTYKVSMGVYAFNLDILSFIPDNTSFGFDTLMHTLLEKQIPISTFPFKGRWFDIGRQNDYRVATTVFERHRTEFLPEEPPARPTTIKPLANDVTPEEY